MLHVVMRSNGILPVNIALAWAYYCFYINMFYINDLLKAEHVRIEGYKFAVRVLKICEKN